MADLIIEELIDEFTEELSRYPEFFRDCYLLSQIGGLTDIFRECFQDKTKVQNYKGLMPEDLYNKFENFIGSKKVYLLG